MPVRTKLVLVVHRVEAAKPTNTARLLHRLVPSSELHLVGIPHQTTDISSSIVPGSTPLVLFPEPSSPVLDAQYVARCAGQISLIIPDGTWKQARKMAHHLPALQGIPRVRLAPQGKSVYTLRRNQASGGLCTLEAVAHALGVLEGEGVQDMLESYLSMMVERVMWSRRTSQTYHEVPPR